MNLQRDQKDNKVLNNRFWRKLCVIVACSAIALAVLAAGVTLTLLLCSLQPERFTVSSKVGDRNEDPYLVKDSHLHAHSANITLKGEVDNDVKVSVIGTSSTPPHNSSQHLNTTIPELSGPNSRYNYNYYGADEPIYLYAGSFLTYTMSTSSVPATKCPVSLHFFDNVTNYSNFLNYDDPQEVAKSPCLLVGAMYSWKFRANQSSSIYVALEITDNILVTGNITGRRDYYNITGLTSESLCHLTASNRSCLVSLCDSFYCPRPKPNRNCIFLKVSSSSNVVNVDADFTGPCIYGSLKFSGFVIGTILATAAVVALAFLACSISIRHIRHHLSGYEELPV